MIEWNHLKHTEFISPDKCREASSLIKQSDQVPVASEATVSVAGSGFAEGSAIIAGVFRDHNRAMGEMFACIGGDEGEKRTGVGSAEGTGSLGPIGADGGSTATEAEGGGGRSCPTGN